MEDLLTRLSALTAPVAAEHGLDLVDLEVRGQGRGRLVRVLVDRDGGVDLGSCRAVDRALSPLLDDLEDLDDGFRLEVSSPGTDRPLQGRRAFQRVAGRLVRVHRVDGLAPAELTGTVARADDDAVVLSIDGSERPVPYAEIAKAVQALPW